MRKDKLVSEVLGQNVALSPSDLMSVDIRSVLVGGYDKLEVETVIERAANALEQSLNENRRLRQQIDDQRAQLSQYQEMESTLRSALVSSQKYSETLVNSAKAQADALIEEARLIKAQAQFHMAEMPAALRTEISQLKDLRDRLRQDLEAVLKTHESLLERIPAAEDRQEEEARGEQRGHFVDWGGDHGAEEEPARKAPTPKETSFNPPPGAHLDFDDDGEGGA